jgi:hypothetical protein
MQQVAPSLDHGKEGSIAIVEASFALGFEDNLKASRAFRGSVILQDNRYDQTSTDFCADLPQRPCAHNLPDFRVGVSIRHRHAAPRSPGFVLVCQFVEKALALNHQRSTLFFSVILSPFSRREASSSGNSVVAYRTIARSAPFIDYSRYRRLASKYAL